MNKNSSKKIATETLARAPFSVRAKRLLEVLANLPEDGTEGMQKLRTRFPCVLEDLPHRTITKEKETDDGESYPVFTRSDEDSKYEYLILPLRNRLRALWRAPDRYTKRWGVFRISQDFFLQGDRNLLTGTVDDEADFSLRGIHPPCRTERMISEFIDLVDYACYCDGSECSKPYFIASRRGQKYCSPKCAQEFQKKFKREWWAEHGDSWRKARANKEGKKRD